MLKGSTNTLATWCKELTPWKRHWCWERLKAGGEVDNRGWDGWMASQLDGHEFEQALEVGDGQGSLACCSPWGCMQRVRHDWTTQLNWTHQCHLHITLFIACIRQCICLLGIERMKQEGCYFALRCPYCMPCAHVLSCFSRVQLFATLWTVARQASLSMGILQARTLEWVAMPFCRGSSQPRDRTHISMSPALVGGFFNTSTTWEALVRTKSFHWFGKDLNSLLEPWVLEGARCWHLCSRCLQFI